MRVVRYLALVVAATAVAIATVHQHVERTQLGYQTRELERDMKRLEEARKAALLDREHASAPEKLLARARKYNVASEAELKALVAPIAPSPAPKGHP